MVDTLPSGFEVDEASVTASGGTLSGNKITWNVTLDVGEVKTFTYSGTVAPGAEGDLVNRVVLTLEDGTIEDSTTHPVSPVSPIEDEDDEEKVDGEELADTGANGVGNLVGAALLAMLAGGLMVTFGRRRREQ
jgi:LPXTG-motif cell wall-anchored protein